MKTVKSICVVSEGYPTKTNPAFSFVDQLVCAISDLGVKCTVISPQSVTHALSSREKLLPLKSERVTEKGNCIKVLRPYYITFSNRTKTLNHRLFSLAVKRDYNRLKQKPEVMYGHFWESAIAAAKAVKKDGLPVFVACGESTIRILNLYPLEKLAPYLPCIKGVISVSTENKTECIRLGLSKKEQIEVFPNGIDEKVFRKTDRQKVREKLSVPQKSFTICFVGYLNDRKGPLRVSEAIKQLDGEVNSFFIGSGTQIPDCKGILHIGKVPHDELPDYLNAADAFVLPTRAEGCCNAIIEAMACGLPIVSSNLEFNDDILKSNNSIRVNPDSVSEIAEAIGRLREDTGLRRRMGEESLNIANGLNLKTRAQKILYFIGEKI